MTERRERHEDDFEERTSRLQSELRALARQIIIAPLLPLGVEPGNPESIQNWARNHPEESEKVMAIWQFREQLVEHLAQLMQRDPWLPSLLRRILAESEKLPPSSANH